MADWTVKKTSAHTHTRHWRSKAVRARSLPARGHRSHRALRPQKGPQRPEFTTSPLLLAGIQADKSGSPPLPPAAGLHWHTRCILGARHPSLPTQSSHALCNGLRAFWSPARLDFPRLWTHLRLFPERGRAALLRFDDSNCPTDSIFASTTCFIAAARSSMDATLAPRPSDSRSITRAWRRSLSALSDHDGSKARAAKPAHHTPSTQIQVSQARLCISGRSLSRARSCCGGIGFSSPSLSQWYAQTLQEARASAMCTSAEHGAQAIAHGTVQ